MIKRQRAFQTPTPTPDLPDDTVDDIMSMLPAKSICRFSDLCDSVKTDSPFEDTSLAVEIIGSSHGLILMRIHDNCHWRTTRRECQYFLWIPCTRELKEILIPKVEAGPADYQKIDLDDVFSVTYGVNLNCDTNDYQIVIATCNGSYARGVCYGTEIQVYSSESSSWKTISNILPYEITNMYYDRAGVIFVSGAFHWLARQVQSKRRLCIVSFDIHRENFNEVAVTPQVDDMLNDFNYVHKALGVLGGSLCIVGADGGLNIDVWVMKDYNVTKS
ncbi:F-box/kelch-repeat protein At3g06240-like [Papaver somniferum]|uniref:F-box/kelch-repeat protein At3g06240-like n=1 Tax=Papaver somniferum TaxID=3469 RepID=UPI000E6F691B|nr:F-box/kelch-repeat protein At3g06240-like [Papaver somniferum]